MQQQQQQQSPVSPGHLEQGLRRSAQAAGEGAEVILGLNTSSRGRE